jgi:hypothetical protein
VPPAPLISSLSRRGNFNCQPKLHFKNVFNCFWLAQPYIGA